MTKTHQRYTEVMEDQRAFFDALITDDWGSYINEQWDFSRRQEVDRLLQRIRPRRVLDVGCGCGFHDVEFANRDFIEEVTGIDYSARSIEKAEEAYPHPKVRRFVADLRELPTGDPFELVVSFQVIEHLPDPADYFRSCVRLVRPGGHVAVVTPNVNRLDNVLNRLRGRPATLIDSQHFAEYSRGQLKALARDHGLVEVDHFGYGLFSQVWPWITPTDHRRAIRRGASLPAVANIIGVVFQRG